MPPGDFLGFFVSSVGAGGALVGLLFVAVSLAPERTIAPSAPAHARASALSAFTLANAALYGAELLYVALPLRTHPDNRAPFYVLAFLLIGIYASALTRAWTLMGGGSIHVFSRALELARKEARAAVPADRAK
jgi:hypothetical protein